MRTVSQLLIAGLLAVVIAQAEVVDSLVAVVGSAAIKHSDVLRDVRMTAFLNKGSVKTDQKSQEEAMNRLIDQALIRQEIEAGAYELAAPSRVEEAVKPVQESYGGAVAFQSALQRYGITADDLRAYLRWQITVVDFVELRFGNGLAGDATTASDHAPTADPFIAWLDSARKNQRIITKPERLK
ncbi:MAG: hypothetical protein ABI824_00400 [Acidobacteriota bacterium]